MKIHNKFLIENLLVFIELKLKNINTIRSIFFHSMAVEIDDFHLKLNRQH